MIEFWALFIAFRLPVIVATFALVGFSLWKAIRAFRAGRAVKAALWLALASLPFVWFFYENVRAYDERSARISYIDSVPKKPMIRPHQRLLEIHGDFPREVTEAFLNSGLFDKIIQFERGGRDNSIESAFIFGPIKTDECIKDASADIIKISSGQFLGFNNYGPSPCSSVDIEKYQSFDPNRSAVVLLLDNSSTINTSRTVWSGGTVEIRQRNKGEDRLVDYREHPYVSRPVVSLWYTSQPLDTSLPFNAGQILLADVR